MKEITNFLTESLMGARRQKIDAANKKHQHALDEILRLLSELYNNEINFRMTHVAPQDITTEVEAQYADEAIDDWQVYQSTRPADLRREWEELAPEEQKTVIAAYVQNNGFKTSRLAYDTVIDSKLLHSLEELTNAFYDRINGLPVEELFFTIDEFDELNEYIGSSAKANTLRNLFWMQQKHADRASILYSDLYDNIDMINYIVLDN